MVLFTHAGSCSSPHSGLNMRFSLLWVDVDGVVYLLIQAEKF